jgi:UDP-N-acetylglucosamine--N-acetylmuramyl-(pentapeptide) pyrophosphoryl-undecaprenol N-acetylglucosamine transferase
VVRADGRATERGGQPPSGRRCRWDAGLSEARARRIVLTGGGTAGHVTPNLALLPALEERGFEAQYVGSRAGIERRLVEEAGLPFHAVRTGKLRRYLSLENLVDPFRILFGICEAALLLRRLRPSVVFSKGGFVGVPVVVGAWLNRVPVVVHESDLTPGLANRLSFPFARRICLAFRETHPGAEGGSPGGGKWVYTGTPVRRSLSEGQRARGFDAFGLDSTKTTLLVFGGSQGAQAINEVVRGALAELPSTLQVLHVCGAGTLDDSCEGVPGYRQFEYLDDAFADAFACADVVVSRAGANSLAELIALRKPAVVIPLPTAASRGDQIDNAKLYAAKGLGRVAEQQTLTPVLLLSEVRHVLEGALGYREAMEREEGRDPIDRIVDVLEQVAR